MDGDEKNVLLLCFDPNNEIDALQPSDLNQINDDFIFHQQSEACWSLIQANPNQKIFLIIPPSQITSSIVDHQQIEQIFIFSLNGVELSHPSAKVIGVYDDTEALFSSIRQQLNFLERDDRLWCLFDPTQFRNRDLADLASDFLWFHLFHELLLNLPTEHRIKKQRVESVTTDSAHKSEEDALIHQLKTEHPRTDALRWFISHPALQPLINRAFRTRNIDLLYDLRSFLSNLLHNLNYESNKITANNQTKSRRAYRTMQLSSDELKQLKQSEGQLILMKGFLTAQSHQPTSFSAEQIHSNSVLFQIDYHSSELGRSFVFANVTPDIEASSHETVLFDFNATFRLESVKRDDQLWMIQLSAVSEGQSILQRYIDDVRRQREESSIPILFGQLLCDLCEWYEARRYFERLKSDLPDEDRAWIDYAIGQTCHSLGKWEEARKYYDVAYDAMLQSEPPRIKDSAFLLNSIGSILSSQGKYDQSSEFYERAAMIREQYYTQNHVRTATCLKNVAFIHSQRQKYGEALALYQEALAILNKYYDSFHPEVAAVLSNIGSIEEDQENYNEALSRHQQALTMYKVYNPAGHASIANFLNHISFILRRQEKYEEAYRYAKEALKIQRRFYPYGHVNMVSSLYGIARVENREKESNRSLEACEKILRIEQNYYPVGHLEIINTLSILGFMYLYRKQDCERSFNYYQEALHLLETHYPSYYGHIAIALYDIGNVLRKQTKYDEAMDFYSRALDMQEKYYSADHTSMLDVLNNMARILVEQGKHEEALAHLHRALTIREKFHIPHHKNIACSLRIIGETKLNQGKFDEALEYLQKALAIFEQHHATDFNQIHISLETIADVFWRQLRYDRAGEYLKRCLSLSERYFPSAYSKTIRVLFNLAQSHQLRQQYQSALDYELRCLLIQEQFLAPDHQEIGESLKIIGSCHHGLHQPQLALAYYRRSRDVYRQCLPVEHLERKGVEAMVQQLCDELEIRNI